LTIHIPKKNIVDNVLAWLGKSRGVIIPAQVYRKYGPYGYVSAKRENWFKAFMRPRSSLFPAGVLNPELIEQMTEISQRHEILFCHDLLSFLELKFPNANFSDNFQGHSKAEFFFIHNNSFYLVEAKSEAETAGSKHSGWQGSFQDIRNKIRSLGIENRYNKWLLYLAQLNDYVIHNRHKVQACKCDRLYVMLGLPLTELTSCKQAIALATQSSVFPELIYESGQDVDRQVAYIVAKEESLSIFFGSTIEN
jgi:hypothetical protein